MVSLIGVRSGSLPSFSIGSLLSAGPRTQHEILVDDHAQWKSGADGDGGLDVEIPGDDLLPGLTAGLLGRLADGPDEVALAVDGQLRSDPEQGGKRDALEESPCMEIHLVGEPGVARGIRRREVVELNRSAVRQDDALPDQKRPALTEGLDAVIGADQPRAVWDKQDASCLGACGVICGMCSADAR